MELYGLYRRNYLQLNKVRIINKLKYLVNTWCRSQNNNRLYLLKLFLLCYSSKIELEKIMFSKEKKLCIIELTTEGSGLLANN